MIELRPHVGEHMGDGRSVHHSQDMVFFDGDHVGYIGHQPGAPLNLIRRLDDDTIQAINAKVLQIRGFVPSMASLPFGPSDDDEDDDGDEEDTWLDEGDEEADG